MQSPSDVRLGVLVDHERQPTDRVSLVVLQVEHWADNTHSNPSQTADPFNVGK